MPDRACPRVSHRSLRLGLTLAVVMLAGCRGTPSLPVAPMLENPTGSTLFSVEIKAPAQAVAPGETLALEAEGRDDRDTPIAVTPTWRSSDPAIATVDAAGLVTGRAKGLVTITALTQNPPREASLQLTVGALPPAPMPPQAGGPPQPGPLPLGPGSFPGGSPSAGAAPPAPTGYGLAIYPALPRVAPGETLRMLALQGPSGFETPAAAVWRTTDARIATVDDAGMVAGIRAGSVQILAQSVAYPALVREITLAVIAPAEPATISGIRLRPSRVVMNVGESFWVQAEVTTFGGGVDPQVSWESGNQAIVTISASGQLQAKAPGKTTITAYAAGSKRVDLSATIPVEVRNSVLGRIRDLF